MGSQRPGGHKVHLEAVEERGSLGRRKRGEDREWQPKKAVGDSIQKEKRGSFENRKESLGERGEQLGGS